MSDFHSSPGEGGLLDGLYPDSLLLLNPQTNYLKKLNKIYFDLGNSIFKEANAASKRIKTVLTQHQ